jgi:hypothetical protein
MMFKCFTCQKIPGGPPETNSNRSSGEVTTLEMRNGAVLPQQPDLSRFSTSVFELDSVLLNVICCERLQAETENAEGEHSET